MVAEDIGKQEKRISCVACCARSHVRSPLHAPSDPLPVRMPRPALHDTRREALRCSFWPFRVTENRVLAALGDARLPAASYAGGVVGGLSAVGHFVKGRGKGIIMREQKLTRRTFLGLGATAAVSYRLQFHRQV